MSVRSGISFSFEAGIDIITYYDYGNAIENVYRAGK